MASSTPSKDTESRPGLLRSSKSFSNQEDTDSIEPLNRVQRANTFQNGAPPQVTVASPTGSGRQVPGKIDAFESEMTEEEEFEHPRASVDMDVIPIELVTRIDNFIAKIFSDYPLDPRNADMLPVREETPKIAEIADRFQQFYGTAADHIQTHISSLARRQAQANSPAPSSFSRASASSFLRAAQKPRTPTKEPEQMLTAEEFANRKKAKRALEQKRVLLEEAVERRLCEGTYELLCRHQNTQDKDGVLRSKTASLDVQQYGLRDLEVDIGINAGEDPEAFRKRQDEIREWLGQARRDLTLMSEKRYPLGKLNHLKAAHKSIVDTLSHFHPSSSADEIVPMLMYTLITMPHENLQAISDLNFIHNFRCAGKQGGEAAYCLTNLEAAVTYLLTIGTATSQPGDESSGSRSDGARGASKTDIFPLVNHAGPSSVGAATGADNAHGSQSQSTNTGWRASVQRRRLSDFIQPAQAIGTASDSLFNTADQGFKTLSNNLGESYKFLLGKLRETTADGRELARPRTLDEARKLVGTPPLEDDTSMDDSALMPDNEETDRPRGERLLSLVGGKRATSRDRSTDSTRSARSGSSTKRVSFISDDGKEKTTPGPSTTPTGPANPALVESMRNLGNSLNPMNRFSGMSMMRGFGRAPTAPVTPTPAAKEAGGKAGDIVDLATAFPDIAASLPPKEVPKIDPPKQRFMELQNPGDLRLGEVLELLRDYRRLAGALKDMGAWKEQ
ncbi:hypothetical protein F4780DRAFT_778021 [Xylariomycetidae sp. FL0641]|nr:hypothetical protein F4780DRAFT_778021 [Xylariomycetidae sp. FL0641]